MDAWYFDREEREHRLEHAAISPPYFVSIRRFLARHRAEEFIRLSLTKQSGSPSVFPDGDLTCDFFELTWKNGPRLTSDGAGPFGEELERMLRTTAADGLLDGNIQGVHGRKDAR